MKAKSIHGQSTKEIQTALDESVQDGFTPTLAFVFMSVKQDRKAICNILELYDIDIFGATSCGEFVNGHHSEGGIVILLMDLSRDSYSILFENVGEHSIEDVSKKIAAAALEKFLYPTMIVCSTGVAEPGYFFDGISLVGSLTESLGIERTFFGGMAGDDMALDETFVFTNNRKTNNGIIVLILDSDKISLHGIAMTGWKRLGVARKVTKSTGKFLYSIDDQPAVDMYLKYLGKSGNRDFNLLNELSFNFPFLTERENKDDILIKSPIRIDHLENALVMDMEMKEGEIFWFSVPPNFDIVEEIVHEAKEMKNNIGNDADALLIFSCAGREPALGPFVNMENEGLSEVWNSPMAGFFSYGEFGRAKNSQQNFHSGACCWVAFKEN
jgi:hypothetical protein